MPLFLTNFDFAKINFASQPGKGNTCPFCSSALSSKSKRNRHIKDSCKVLLSNLSRIKGTQRTLFNAIVRNPTSLFHSPVIKR
jgi:hypothetical protein